MDAPETSKARAFRAGSSAAAQGDSGGARNASADLQAPKDDRQLLDVFHQEIIALTKEYASVLQAIIALRHDPDHSRVSTDIERQISSKIAQLDRPSALTVAELGHVLEFLTEIRAIGSTLPATHAGCSGESAHFLALLVFDQVKEMWDHCAKIALKSQTQANYAYKTTAGRLFVTTWIEKREPHPQELHGLLILEYQAAKRELERRSQQAAKTQLHTDHVSVTGATVTVMPGSGAPTTPASQALQPKVERFPTPDGTQWCHILIRFVDGHAVLITTGDVYGRFNYTQMGMNDRRTGSPNKQWKLLRAFAEGHGLLTWASRDADSKNQKRKETLATNLKQFFGIDADPFQTDSGGWRTLFLIEPDA